MFWPELNSRCACLQYQQRGEVLLCKSVSDERLDLLPADSCERHRHVQPSAQFEPEVHILTQQLGRKRDLEVEIDESGRLVAREHRAHHALVEKIEKRTPGDPCFLSE